MNHYQKYKQAETLFLQAIAIYEQSLGAEHAETADSLYGLAKLYHQMGKYEQADALYQRTLAVREQHLGTTHPDTADSLYGLAKLYQRIEKYEQVDALYQRVLAIYEQQLGVEHPNTRTVRDDYIVFLSKIKHEPDKGKEVSTD